MCIVVSQYLRWCHNEIPCGVRVSGRVNHRGHRIGARKMYVILFRHPSGQDKSRGLLPSSSSSPPPPPPPFTCVWTGRSTRPVEGAITEAPSTTADTPEAVLATVTVEAEFPMAAATAAVVSAFTIVSTGVISPPITCQWFKLLSFLDFGKCNLISNLFMYGFRPPFVVYHV